MLLVISLCILILSSILLFSAYRLWKLVQKTRTRVLLKFVGLDKTEYLWCYVSVRRQILDFNSGEGPFVTGLNAKGEEILINMRMIKEVRDCSLPLIFFKG